MTHIRSFSDMNHKGMMDTVMNVLAEPIRDLLTKRGDLPKEAIRYFINRAYGIDIRQGDMDKTLQVLSGSHERHRSILKYWDAENNCNMYANPRYDKAGNPIHRVNLAPPADYVDGYYDLLLRYQAIRANPELATTAEAYIDSLYNPQFTAKLVDDGDV